MSLDKIPCGWLFMFGVQISSLYFVFFFLLSILITGWLVMTLRLPIAAAPIRGEEIWSRDSIAKA